MRFRVQGSGFRVQGSGLRDKGLRDKDTAFEVSSFLFRAHGIGFRMTVSGTIPLLISAFRDLIFFPCKVVFTFFPKSLGEARKTLPRYAFLPR